MVPKNEESDTEIKQGVGGFQKSYVIFGGGMPKYNDKIYHKLYTGFNVYFNKCGLE